MAKDIVSMGADAKRLLADPAFAEAHKAIEGELIDALCMIQLTGDADCMYLVVEKVRDLQANRRLKRKLTEYAAHGKARERQLEAVADKPKRVNDPRWS